MDLNKKKNYYKDKYREIELIGRGNFGIILIFL